MSGSKVEPGGQSYSTVRLRARAGRRMLACGVLLAAARAGGSVLSFDEKLRGFAADLGVGVC